MWATHQLWTIYPGFLGLKNYFPWSFCNLCHQCRKLKITASSVAPNSWCCGVLYCLCILRRYTLLTLKSCITVNDWHQFVQVFLCVANCFSVVDYLTQNSCFVRTFLHTLLLYTSVDGSCLWYAGDEGNSSPQTNPWSRSKF